MICFFNFQDCPEEAHGNWTCIQGLPGGIDDGKILESNCSWTSQLFAPNDWSSFLCISGDRSPYLGLYYDEPILVNLGLPKASNSPIGSYAEDPEFNSNLPKVIIDIEQSSLLPHARSVALMGRADDVS
jgi:hypothetical protein